MSETKPSLATTKLKQAAVMARKRLSAYSEEAVKVLRQHQLHATPARLEQVYDEVHATLLDLYDSIFEVQEADADIHALILKNQADDLERQRPKVVKNTISALEDLELNEATAKKFITMKLKDTAFRFDQNVHDEVLEGLGFLNTSTAQPTLPEEEEK